MKYTFFAGLFFVAACSTLEPSTKVSTEDTHTSSIIVDDSKLNSNIPNTNSGSCSSQVWNPSLVHNKQFVSIGFDGSYNLDVWDETLDFAQENNVKFTFYVVANHFISDDLRDIYNPPRYRSGRSDVGFGGTKEEVVERLKKLVRAYNEGHSIASHANGHWDGSDWSKEEWDSELSQFEYILRNAYEINEISSHKPEEWDEVVDSIIGFRAPLLAHNDEMYQSLSQHGYKYDTSFPGFFGNSPSIKKNGLWGFPLVSINTSTGKVLSMDYNFLVKDKKLSNIEAEEKMYNAYIGYFQDSMQLSSKPPIQIGHHFSRWKNGAYWNALQRFIKNICNSEDAICETNDYLYQRISENFNNECY